MAAEATVGNRNWKRKREFIGTIVETVSQHVQFAILEAERETLSQEWDIRIAAKNIGKAGPGRSSEILAHIWKYDATS